MNKLVEKAVSTPTYKASVAGIVFSANCPSNGRLAVAGLAAAAVRKVMPSPDQEGHGWHLRVLQQAAQAASLRGTAAQAAQGPQG